MVERRARHWLWITRPEYYLDESGRPSADLEPAAGFAPSAWWTCSPETRAGDTALLYRSRKLKDIAHFLIVRSDAEPLDLPGNEFHGKHVCQFEVIEMLRKPVTWDAIKANDRLQAWHAVRTHFVRSYYDVPDDCWHELITLANNDPEALAKQAVDGLLRIQFERDIQRRLIDQPALPHDAGLRGLTLLRHEILFANGRRADLVYSQRAGLLKRCDHRAEAGGGRSSNDRAGLRLRGSATPRHESSPPPSLHRRGRRKPSHQGRRHGRSRRPTPPIHLTQRTQDREGVTGPAAPRPTGSVR